jgi:hypothetical protein
MANAPGVHLVRVITDDRQHQLWAAATPREEAVDQVLDAVPEGWAAALLSNSLKPEEMEILNLKPGEVREITNPSDPIRSKIPAPQQTIALNTGAANGQRVQDRRTMRVFGTWPLPIGATSSRGRGAG